MKLLEEMTLMEGASIELDTTFDAVKKKFGSNAKLEPTLSVRNVKFHLDTLTKGYFDKVKEKGSPFAFCGAKLHEIWWEQFNGEQGESEAALKELGYDNLTSFIDSIVAAAETIQGNGWVVVTKEALVPITNHSFAAFDDIIMLIDLWEHAYQVDYKADKKTYITKLIKNAVSWDVVSSRLNVKSNP